MPNPNKIRSPICVARDFLVSTLFHRTGSGAIKISQSDTIHGIGITR